MKTAERIKLFQEQVKRSIEENRSLRGRAKAPKGED